MDPWVPASLPPGALHGSVRAAAAELRRGADAFLTSTGPDEGFGLRRFQFEESCIRFLLHGADPSELAREILSGFDDGGSRDARDLSLRDLDEFLQAVRWAAVPGARRASVLGVVTRRDTGIPCRVLVETRPGQGGIDVRFPIDEATGQGIRVAIAATFAWMRWESRIGFADGLSGLDLRIWAGGYPWPLPEPDLQGVIEPDDSVAGGVRGNSLEAAVAAALVSCLIPPALSFGPDLMITGGVGAQGLAIAVDDCNLKAEAAAGLQRRLLCPASNTEHDALPETPRSYSTLRDLITCRLPLAMVGKAPEASQGVLSAGGTLYERSVLVGLDVLPGVPESFPVGKVTEVVAPPGAGKSVFLSSLYVQARESGQRSAAHVDLHTPAPLNRAVRGRRRGQRHKDRAPRPEWDSAGLMDRLAASLNLATGYLNDCLRAPGVLITVDWPFRVADPVWAGEWLRHLEKAVEGTPSTVVVGRDSPGPNAESVMRLAPLDVDAARASLLGAGVLPDRMADATRLLGVKDGQVENLVRLRAVADLLSGEREDRDPVSSAELMSRWVGLSTWHPEQASDEPPPFAELRRLALYLSAWDQSLPIPPERSYARLDGWISTCPFVASDGRGYRFLHRQVQEHLAAEAAAEKPELLLDYWPRDERFDRIAGIAAALTHAGRYESDAPKVVFDTSKKELGHQRRMVVVGAFEDYSLPSQTPPEELEGLRDPKLVADTRSGLKRFFRVSDWRELIDSLADLLSWVKLPAGIGILAALLIDRVDLALLVYLIGQILDLFDGEVARRTGRATPGGAALDKTTDFVFHGFVWIGLLLRLDKSRPFVLVLAFALFALTAASQALPRPASAPESADESVEAKLVSGLMRLALVGLLIWDVGVGEVALSVSVGIFLIVAVLREIRATTKEVRAGTRFFAWRWLERVWMTIPGVDR